MLVNNAVKLRSQPHPPVGASQRLCYFLMGWVSLMFGALLLLPTRPSPSVLGSLFSNMPSRWLVANLFLQAVTS